MQRSEINTIIRQFVRDDISPSKDDRHFISTIYDSFRDLLNDNCIQIGSYPRYTATRPLHDLDILFLSGEWDSTLPNPETVLASLLETIESDYENPTDLRYRVQQQTHSIAVEYYENIDLVFSVDVVPGYSFARNDFEQDVYMVPEILGYKHGEQRRTHYSLLESSGSTMRWISSDPRGYIKIASDLNEMNSDFRRAVKYTKAWKNGYVSLNDEFKLKSFHIEQVMVGYFKENPGLDVFGALFQFFVDLPEFINKPNIPDRADPERFIDEYLKDLSDNQRRLIIEARDCFLVKLEDFDTESGLGALFSPCFRARSGPSEQFLFDLGIPTFLDPDYELRIEGEVQERQGSFRKFILDRIGKILVDRRIRFSVRTPIPGIDLYKWKVKNDSVSPQPRGEITDHRTKNDPEHTKYRGDHYVECFAIKDGVCIAKVRQNVTLSAGR